jgi:hypothetical protein
MKILENIIFEEVSKLLKELKLDDIGREFKTQRDIGFYNHGGHVDYMQKDAGVFPKFKEFKNGVFHFTHESSGEWEHTADQDYDVFVKFYAWPEVVNLVQNDKTPKEVTDFLYAGDLGVYCSCRSFLYHYSRAATEKDAYVVYQDIPSPITNPNLVGIGCKHLDACLSKRVIKFQYSTVMNKANQHRKKVAKKAIDSMKK